LPAPAAKSKSPAKTTAAAKAVAQAEAQPQAKDQPLSRRVRQHRLLVRSLLAQLGMVEASLNIDQLFGRRAAPQKTWVALYDDGGTGIKGRAAIEPILGAAGMQVLRVGPEELAGGTLSDVDLTIFPGGIGSKEAAAIGESGRQQVRQFVERGGGYLGICAGAYLCTNGFDWSLKILAAKTVSPQWNRGAGTVKIELTPAGRQILGDRPGLLDVIYHNGPIVAPNPVDSLPDYEVLAYFRTELAKNGTPVDVMTNSPAIAAGHCGHGRVVFISPHPEQTPGLEDLVRRAALWAVGKN
jgi:hypothetical protein